MKMPTYSFKCQADEAHSFEKTLSFAAYDKVQAGEVPIPCPTCGSPASTYFNPGEMGMVLVDGESGGWASKVGIERQYRAKRYKEMGRRQKDHVKVNKLIPNYGGQDTGTWREAQEQARKDGGDVSTYTPLVHKEGTA